MTAEEYRANAAECLALAQQVANPQHKAKLLQMAQAWNELAEHATRMTAGKQSDEPTR
jgi:hypothetical protein